MRQPLIVVMLVLLLGSNASAKKPKYRIAKRGLYLPIAEGRFLVVSLTEHMYRFGDWRTDGSTGVRQGWGLGWMLSPNPRVRGDDANATVQVLVRRAIGRDQTGMPWIFVMETYVEDEQVRAEHGKVFDRVLKSLYCWYLDR